MNLHELVSDFLIDTKGTADPSLGAIAADSSLWAFRPELALCAAILLLLLVRVFNFGRRIDAFYFALAGGLAALFFAVPPQWIGSGASPVAPMEIFGGMLVYDGFTAYVRMVVMLFAVLFVLFTKLTGVPEKEDGADIYTLVLGASLGFCLMASANHLLMVFLAVEMASVPSYAMAGMVKRHRKGSEAALKYSVYGAGAAGVMLYGISLLAGVLNSAHIPTMAGELAANLGGFSGQELMVLALGGLMVSVGLAFKLSAVPFHFWAPDVFEGATAEIGAFLSVASKAAALALLVRVALGFGIMPPERDTPLQRYAAANAAEAKPEAAAAITPAAAPEASAISLYHVAEEAAAEEPAEPAAEEGEAASAEPLSPVRTFIAQLIAVIAIVTCTFGNLAAYGQKNIKRLMAYSTIAHAGYMMMPVPAVLALAPQNAALAETAVASLALYMIVYLFMNLGAFAVIAVLRNAMKSEEIADYAGLIRRCPGLVVCMGIILFSLVGLPPLAGFVGKFAIFAALVDAYRVTGQSYLMVLLFAGGLNTAISLFYYLRVIKVMTIDPEPEDRTPFELSEVSLQSIFLWGITAPSVLLFFFWQSLYAWAHLAARHLVS